MAAPAAITIGTTVLAAIMWTSLKEEDQVRLEQEGL